MDLEKVKLIVNNMESLVKILKQEISDESKLQEYFTAVPFVEDEDDEVYSE